MANAKTRERTYAHVFRVDDIKLAAAVTAFAEHSLLMGKLNEISTEKECRLSKLPPELLQGIGSFLLDYMYQDQMPCFEEVKKCVAKECLEKYKSGDKPSHLYARHDDNLAADDAVFSLSTTGPRTPAGERFKAAIELFAEHFKLSPYFAKSDDEPRSAITRKPFGLLLSMGNKSLTESQRVQLKSDLLGLGLWELDEAAILRYPSVLWLQPVRFLSSTSPRMFSVTEDEIAAFKRVEQRFGFLGSENLDSIARMKVSKAST